VITVCCVILGTIEACILNRMAPPWRTRFLLLIISPLLISVLACTLGWSILLGRNGLINQFAMAVGMWEPFSILFTPLAVIIGFVHVLVPFVVLSVWSVLQRCDPSVERAAIALGASARTAFLRVILPQIAPGIISGGLVVFALASSAFAIPAILGGRRVKVISIAIYDEFLGSLNWPLGAAIAMVMLLLSAVIIVGGTRLLERRLRIREL
jgi:putative spermidine/putrescine transport system permease protein